MELYEYTYISFNLNVSIILWAPVLERERWLKQSDDEIVKGR